MHLPNEILIPQVAELVRNGHTVKLPLRGYSMRPYLEDGRDCALLGAVPETLKVGDVVLAEIVPKKWALHRIVYIKDDVIIMYGDGNFSPEYITRQDVVAIALGFYRKGREKLESVVSTKYIIYWRMWVMLRPFRRYLLFLWKLCHYPRQTMERVKQKITKI